MWTERLMAAPPGLPRPVLPLLFFPLFLLLQAVSVPSAFGVEVAVVSSGFAGYEDTLRGFESASSASVNKYRLGDYDPKALTEKILKSKPKLILAVGSDALQSVGEVGEIPIISVMTLNLKNKVPEGKAITGVDMALPVGKQLDVLRLVLPNAKRIGVIYNPGETGHMVREAESAASSRGLTLVSRPVGGPQEAVSVISGLRGNIDVIWLLPDITVLDYELIRYIMLFSYENNIPVYSFSEKYVKNSALMAFSIDFHGVGVQAGEMANKILSGTDARKMPVAYSEKGELFLNLRTAEKLGIKVPEEAIKRAKKIYGRGD